jgi:hypothetical protein
LISFTVIIWLPAIINSIAEAACIILDLQRNRLLSELEVRAVVCKRRSQHKEVADIVKSERVGWGSPLTKNRNS